MAAIPDAGGARCAPYAVMLRALLRVVVLGCLVITGWLLGSGTGLANEDPGHKNLTENTGLFGLVTASSPDEGFSGPLGAPPVVVESALRGLTRAAPVQRLVKQPPAHVPVVTPVLARVSERVAAPVLEPVVKRATPAPAATPRAAVDKPTLAPLDPVPVAAVPLAGPVQAGPAPAHAPSTVAPTVDEVASATQVSTTARPVASQFAGPPALGGAPAAPAPVSPPGTTATTCGVGSSGGGTNTQSAHFATLGDRWAMADLAPRQRLHTSCGSIPRSAAEQPSSSPD